MDLDARLTHHVDQAVAAYMAGNSAEVKRIFVRMHDDGLCDAAHDLIAGLNRISMIRISALQSLGVQVDITVFPVD